MSKDSSRRDFIKKSAALALGSFLLSDIKSNGLNTENIIFLNNKPLNEKPTFSLPALPYSYDALEPHIDKLTMEIHHSKHHQAYVTNLNKALENVDSSLVGNNFEIESIFVNIDKLPVAVRNNGGGHYNHSLFWTLMKPNTGGIVKGKLLEAINTNFGSFEAFKNKFSEVAMSRFGSGWAWLVVTKNGLAITSTPNQDNPLMNLSSIEVKGTPVLALDLWEHAYYLKNQNRRADYLTSWWNVVNWETAETLYNKTSH
jgi:Fe-Mn family superoxide dismutase